MDNSFGFLTSVSESIHFITAANVEAEAAEYGIGIVRIMGTYSGIVATAACISSRDVNICLIPELKF